LRKKAPALEVAERDEKREAIAEFRALIAERRTWAFRRTAGPDANGKEHYACPGAGRVGPATATAVTAPSQRLSRNFMQHDAAIR